MTTAPPGLRPGQAQIWHAGKMVDGDATAEQVGDVLHADPNAMAWIFLPRESTDSFRAAAGYFDLDALAEEDVLGADEGCKLDWLDETLVLLTSFARCQRGASEVEMLPISVLTDRRVLVVLADETVGPLLQSQLRKTRAEFLQDGVAGALHTVLDTIVDSYTQALSHLTDQADELSDLLFDDKPLRRQDQLRAFALRRSLARLRRTVDPMVDVTAGLSNGAKRGTGQSATDPAEKLLGAASAREFADVADHAAHASSAVKSLREEIASMYETNLSLSDVHLNSVMKKLAGWAAIIAVPTLITGFMGMNVPYPGFSHWSGFVTALSVMVAAVAGLYWLFRRKDWL